MQLPTRLPSSISAAVVSALLLIPSSALAHIDLIEPEARAHGTAASGDMMVDTNTNQKSGPCGQVTNMRTDRVTTYEPGETITVRVSEETPHESYIRVSIDLDGDDDFPSRPIMSTPAETQDVAQAAEDALNTENTLLAVVRETNGTPNFVHEIQVTLPDETCESCTLQVIQFMYGAGNPYYFQCADIVIAEGGGGEAGAGGEAGMGGGANGGASGSAGTGGASGAAGSGMPSGQAGTLAGNTDGYPEDPSCSLGSVPASRTSHYTLMAVLGLGLAGLARRRSSARQARGLTTH